MNGFDHVQQIDKIAGDRRFDRRYGLELEVRWKLIRRRKVREVGVGHTVNLSSGGILFEATQSLPVGMNVELAISWPVLLHNIAPMQLIVGGRIIRSSGTQAAIQMTQHEFRTVGASAERRQALAAACRAPAPTPIAIAKVQ